MSSSYKIFYKNVIRRLEITGSIAPSSRFLAEAITRCVCPGDGPLRILEAGPGTGPFTRFLAAKIRPIDRLDLCELNEEFVHYLQGLLVTDPLLQRRASQITIYHQLVQTLLGEKKYDFIISGLPLNNFPHEMVEEILESFQRLLKSGGKLAFFEYFMVRKIKSSFFYGRAGERMKKRNAILKRHLDAHESHQIFVALNFPPSVVHVCEYN